MLWPNKVFGPCWVAWLNWVIGAPKQLESIKLWDFSKWLDSERRCPFLVKNSAFTRY